MNATNPKPIASQQESIVNCDVRQANSRFLTLPAPRGRLAPRLHTKKKHNKKNENKEMQRLSRMLRFENMLKVNEIGGPSAEPGDSQRSSNARNIPTDVGVRGAKPRAVQCG
jgi:hypothetical protein